MNVMFRDHKLKFIPSFCCSLDITILVSLFSSKFMCLVFKHSIDNAFLFKSVLKETGQAFKILLARSLNNKHLKLFFSSVFLFINI